MLLSIVMVIDNVIVIVLVIVIVVIIVVVIVIVIAIVIVDCFGCQLLWLLMAGVDCSLWMLLIVDCC